MQRQHNRQRLFQLMEQFPILTDIREIYGYPDQNNQGKIRKPFLEVYVQRADTDTMHLKGENFNTNARWYLMNRKDTCRGTKRDFCLAIDHYGRLAKALFWQRNDGTTVLKDIFRGLDHTSINYLVWVSEIDWFSNPTPEQEANDVLFGSHLSKKIRAIIYRKPKDKTFLELIEIADREKKEREDAYKYNPKKMPDFPSIEKALQEGCKMHAFSSGGGLRVVSLALGDTQKAYGEHPHIEQALEHLNDDYLAGGRQYHLVYGRKEIHYLTGSPLPTSNIDFWIRRGSTFDCWREGETVIFQLNGYTHSEIPKILCKKLIQNRSCKKVFWQERGFIYKATRSRMANGEFGISWRVIWYPNGERHDKNNEFGCRDSFYRITKTGYGPDFWKAMVAAFQAPEIENLEK